MTAKQQAMILAVLVAAFMALGTQIDLLPALTWHDQQRLGQTAWLVGLLVAAGTSCRECITVGRGVLLALTAVAGAGALSAAMAELPYWAWIEWALLLSLLVSVLLIGRLRRDAGTDFDQAFTWLLCAVCAMLAVRFLATYLAGLAAGAEVDTRELSSLGFSNRRFFGQLQTLTLPLLAVPVILARSQRGRNGAFLLLATWWMLAFVSATRGTFLAMAVAIPLAGIWSGTLGRQWLRWQWAGFAVGLALYALLIFVLPDLLDIETRAESRWARLLDSSGRIESWTFTLDLIRNHPLLGVGPMHLAYWLNPVIPIAHPHNSLLQISAEWGVPAAVLAGGVAIHSSWRLAGRFRGAAATPLTISLMAALIGAAAQSLVDGVIVMPVSQVMLVVIGGWALGIYWQHEAHPLAVPGLRIPGCILTLVLAGMLGVLATIAVRDFPLVTVRQQQYISEHSSYLHPRYWQQGWIGEPQPHPDH